MSCFALSGFRPTCCWRLLFAFCKRPCVYVLPSWCCCCYPDSCDSSRVLVFASNLGCSKCLLTWLVLSTLVMVLSTRALIPSNVKSVLGSSWPPAPGSRGHQGGLLWHSRTLTRCRWHISGILSRLTNQHITPHLTWLLTGWQNGTLMEPHVHADGASFVFPFIWAAIVSLGIRVENIFTRWIKFENYTQLGRFFPISQIFSISQIFDHNCLLNSWKLSLVKKQ